MTIILAPKVERALNEHSQQLGTTPETAGNRDAAPAE